MLLNVLFKQIGSDSLKYIKSIRYNFFAWYMCIKLFLKIYFTCLHLCKVYRATGTKITLKHAIMSYTFACIFDASSHPVWTNIEVHALKIIYLKIRYYNLKFGLFWYIIKRHVIFMIYYYIHFHLLLRTIYHMSQVWPSSIMLYYVHTYMSCGNLKTKFDYNTYEYSYKIVTF